MDLTLEGRTAIITGAASGLGRETAKYLARERVTLERDYKYDEYKYVKDATPTN